MSDIAPESAAPAEEAQAPAAPAPAEQTTEPAPAPASEESDAMRAELESLRAECEQLRAAAAEREGASNEGGAEVSARKLANAEKRAKEAEHALALERVYRKFPELDSDDVRDFLTGENEAEIMAKAERLAKLAAKRGAEEEHHEERRAQQRPAPDLTPGHGGEMREKFDPAAVARAARRFNH